ncbi:MAG: hypothetical protein DHS20C18_40500 [Saprospiraceae bacterium]|nr:MAG: hypothetical protein DHS20C18_40500 [Saprospiraceae bacterium]
MYNNQQYDVLIIGGGPAGTATALTLLRHQPELKVMIVETGNYQQQRVGESLPPLALDALRTLGVAESFLQQNHLPTYGTCAAWGSDELYANEFIFQLNNRGWHLDRCRFDAFLAEEAQDKGATLLCNSKVLNYDKQAEGYDLNIQYQNQPISLKARFLVDASGRNAWLAKREKVAKIRYDKLVGFCRFYYIGEDMPEDTYTLVEAWENGWWYSARLPNRQLIVAAMTDADLAGRYQLNTDKGWQQLLTRSTHTRSRLHTVTTIDQQQAWPAASQRLIRTIGIRWLAVGDAAATLDPLSSQGITNALRTGIFGAYAILDFFKGKSGSLEKYDRWMRESYEDYLETKAQFYSEEQRWPQHAFWKKRQTGIEFESYQNMKLWKSESP